MPTLVMAVASLLMITAASVRAQCVLDGKGRDTAIAKIKSLCMTQQGKLQADCSQQCAAVFAPTYKNCAGNAIGKQMRALPGATVFATMCSDEYGLMKPAGPPPPPAPSLEPSFGGGPCPFVGAGNDAAISKIGKLCCTGEKLPCQLADTCSRTCAQIFNPAYENCKNTAIGKQFRALKRAAQFALECSDFEGLGPPPPPSSRGDAPSPPPPPPSAAAPCPPLTARDKKLRKNDVCKSRCVSRVRDCPQGTRCMNDAELFSGIEQGERGLQFLHVATRSC